MKGKGITQKITLTSMKHFNNLLEEGFRVVGKDYVYENNQSTWTLRLARDNEEIFANANAIDDYVLNLVELYNENTNDTCFIWVPDPSVYFQFEDALIYILPWHNPPPSVTKTIGTQNNYKIYNSLYSWFKNERNRHYGTLNLSEVFSILCVVNENQDSITRMTYGKEFLKLSEIKDILSSSQKYDNSIALSFFMLSNKTGLNKKTEDVLLGLICYDLKNKQTLSFNILSVDSLAKQNILGPNLGFYDAAEILFKHTLSETNEFKSYLPLPIDSPWYTALPWICFSTLLPVELDNLQSTMAPVRKMTIPEFFVFGYPSSALEENSFEFTRFSSTTKGRATCILNINDENAVLKYLLRFDQSHAEPLVHLDFSYYDIEEVKLISHRPLDFESVYSFNHMFFVAMMFAGIFDSYFNSLIHQNLKGIQELAAKNPAFLYTLKWVSILERLIKKVELNDKGYEILGKLYSGRDLDNKESEFADTLQIGDFSLPYKDENGNMSGLTQLGYAALTRFRRRQLNMD